MNNKNVLKVRYILNTLGEALAQTWKKKSHVSTTILKDI